MKRFISLALFGAVSYASAEGTTNPVIVEKLQKILKKTQDM